MQRVPVRHDIAEQGRDLGELIGEALVRVDGTAVEQHAGGARVATRSAAHPEIDAARIHGLEHLELLGDFEGRVIGQHDASGAQPDMLRLGTEPCQQDLRARIGQPVQGVMLRAPVAMIAQPVGELGQLDGPLDGLGRRRGADDGRLVEDREG